MTSPLPTDAPVLVTGATGYFAGVLIRDLLEAGVTVHATVRDVDKTERYRHLLDLPRADGHLHIFKADLLKNKSFADAMEDCRIVFHTAFPYPAGKITDAYKEIVAPAIKGTKNIFNQAKKTPSVKRIVMTSTMWACMSDAQDVVDSEEAILDETMWNSTASLHYQPYAYGKTEAEKDAWIKLEKQDHWDVVTILPGLILGPGTKCHRDNYAFQLMTNFGNGTYKGGVPAISTAVVDVRDVSRAHIEAAFRPRADGRYLCVRHQTDHFEMTQILRNQYPEYEFPKSATSKQYLAMFGSLFSRDMNRKFITRNVGMRFQLDSSRSEEELGIVYRSLHQTLIDMMEQIIEEGLLDKEKMAEEARLKKEEEDRIKQEKKEAKEKRKEERLVREREERDKKKAERAAEKERKRAERQGQRQGGSGAAQPEASVV